MAPPPQRLSRRPPDWTRRQFLAAVSKASTTALATDFASSLAAPAVAPNASGRRKNVALIATEIRKWSHAQHFVDRLLEGYGWDGRHHHPPLKLVSLYVDQFPEGDLSQDRVRRHSVRIYPSIAEALTLGTAKLAVDGVLIIGEHGKYPKNAKGQTRYPRHKFFKEVVRVFERSGRAVPVFNDKHLSTDWKEATEMVHDSKRLGFAFLAGSSLPVTWRIPNLEIPLDAPMSESVSVCYGGIDSYDFHGLETAQCMSERREGGESGMRAIEALGGDRIWERVEQQAETKELLMAALARSHTLRFPSGYNCGLPTIDSLRRASPEAVAYFIEHNDGFKTSMFLLNGSVQDFTYAGRLKAGPGLRHAVGGASRNLEGKGGIHSCQMYLPMPPYPASLANFFSPLMHGIEQTFMSGRAVYPVERTLLTTGMTLSAVESLYQNGARIMTPEMAVTYRASGESTFWRT